MTYAPEHRLEKQRLAQQKWRANPANQVKAKEAYQRWYNAGGKEVRLAYAKDNRKELRLSERSRIRSQRISTLMLLGGKCEHCGNNDHRVLQVDHVNGDGVADRKKKPLVRLSEIFATPERYQLLCANCNWIKRWEKEEMNQIKEIN